MLTSYRENICYLRLSQLCWITKSRYVSSDATVKAVDTILMVATSYLDLRLWSEFGRTCVRMIFKIQMTSAWSAAMTPWKQCSSRKRCTCSRWTRSWVNICMCLTSEGWLTRYAMILSSEGEWHRGMRPSLPICWMGFTEWRPPTCTGKHPFDLEIAWV